MRTFLRIVRRTFWVLLFVGLLYGASLLPLPRCWLLRHFLLAAVDHATVVKVIEHSSPFDGRGFNPEYKESVYATVALTPEQIQELQSSLPICADESGITFTKCIFNEHHKIEIKTWYGSTTTLGICFECGEIRIDDGDKRIMPEKWPVSLRKFISSLGMHPNGPWPPPSAASH